MQTPIVQFGTSRFLQAHALSFFQAGVPLAGPPAVSVVQSTDDPARRGRLQAMAAADGFPVRVRGLENGQPVQREERVQVVKRGLSFADDYDLLARIIATEARWIVSNTADRGFDPAAADSLPGPDPAQSYPAKLFHLLAARHDAGAGPLVILPTELVPDNGSVLKTRVMQIAAEQGASPALHAALTAHVWANSLVDRIVSEEIRPAGAVTEPYALWAIEDPPGLILPVRHPAIQIVPALEPIQRLKLHLLNLGHTVLVDLWQQSGQRETFVREAMVGPLRQALLAVLTEEVLPGFDGQGMGDAARTYLDVTIQRFDNPFLDHRLADIAQNHHAKIAHRISAFLDWATLSPQIAPRLYAITGQVQNISL